MLKSLHLTLFLCFVISQPCIGSGGDAQGIGGGDYMDSEVNLAINDLWNVFRKFKNRSLAPSCRSGCPAGVEKRYCEKLNGMNEAREQACSEVLLELSRQIPSLYPRGGIPVKFSADSLEVMDSDGSQRAVSAVTPIGKEGAITLSRPMLASLSRNGLVALIAHELGHKIKYQKSWIRDNGAVGSFSSGRELLDSVGAQMAILANEHRIPLQEALPLPKSLSKKSYCSSRASDFVLGASIDLQAKIPQYSRGPASQADRYKYSRELARSKDSISVFLGEWFDRLFKREPTSDEVNLLNISLSHETDQATLIASMIQDPEYINSHRINEDREYVVRVMEELSGKAPTQSQLGSLEGTMQLQGRATFLLSLLWKNPSVMKHQINQWHQRFLNREATDLEQAHYTEMLVQGTPWESIHASILATEEYLNLQKKRRETICGATLKE